MSIDQRRKILVFADWYEPGFKAGGPIRSCVNFVRYMREDYLLYVFTTDRDLGSTAPYEGIRTDVWSGAAHPNVRIYYWLGWATLLAYLPLYWYRVYVEDKRAPAIDTKRKAA